jgi:hypothetical protein
MWDARSNIGGGATVARITTVKAARKDAGSCVRCTEPILKGQGYQHVQASRFSPKFKKHTSCPPFKSSELVYDDILGTLYDERDNALAIIDQWDGAKEDQPDPIDDLENALSELADHAGEARDEWQSKLDEMPEGFQRGPSGERLQEKIDAADSYESELQSVDLEEFDEQEFIDEAVEDIEEEDSDVKAKLVAERVQDHRQQWTEQQREEARDLIESLEL